jgi:PKD repeat protein
MKKYLYFLLIIFFAVTGCEKKKYPPSIEENEPQFFIKATIDGNEIDLTAGKNSYQAYSSFEQDSNNLYSFISTLQQNDCNSNACAKSLKLKIYDYKSVALNASVKIDSSLRPGGYGFLDNSKHANYSVNFVGTSNKTAKSYYWNFGDGTSSTLAEPTHVYKKEGKYTVCYQVMSNNGCIATACNQIKVGKNNPLNVAVNHSYSDSLTSSFNSLLSGGKSPYRYYWSFGDGGFSGLKNPTHQYRYQGSYAVQLKVIDANNDTIVCNYNYYTKNDISSCTANYKATINKIMPEAFALSKTVVEWIDDNGVKFTSQNSTQSTSSYFNINTVENYGLNEKNQNTKKLTVSFKCDLSDGNKVLPIVCENANIIVAYK